jgi:hypothetical protein
MRLSTYNPKTCANDLAKAVGEEDFPELAKLLIQYHDRWTDPKNPMVSAKKYALEVFYKLNEGAIKAGEWFTRAKTELNNQKNIGPFNPAILKRKSVECARQYEKGVYNPFVEKIKAATLTPGDIEAFDASAKAAFGEFDQSQKKGIDGLKAAVKSLEAAQMEIENLKSDDIDAQGIHDTYQALVSSNSSSGINRDERVQKAQRGQASQKIAESYYSEIYNGPIQEGNIVLRSGVTLSIPAIKGKRGLKGEFDLLVLKKLEDGRFAVIQIVEVKSSPDLTCLFHDNRCLKKSLKLLVENQDSLVVETVSAKSGHVHNQLSPQATAHSKNLALLAPGAWVKVPVEYYVIHAQSDSGEEISYSLLPYDQVMSLLSGSYALCSLLADTKKSFDERVEAMSIALNIKDPISQFTPFEILRQNMKSTQELVSKIVIGNERAYHSAEFGAGKPENPNVHTIKSGGGAPASASSSSFFASSAAASASSAAASAPASLNSKPAS